MIRVLDLFAGTQSVKKALTKKYNITGWSTPNFDGIQVGWSGGTWAVEYIGIDVYSPEGKNMIIDLTSEFALEMLLDRLEDWKPDFVWASPVCNKLSLATAMKGGHNVYFELNKETKTIKPWPIGSMVDGAKNYQSIIGTTKAYNEAIQALKMFENTKKIINYFNVPFAIENPRHSLTKYIMKDFIINKTSYCMYGFEQNKPTQIFSNKELNLMMCSTETPCKYGPRKHPIGVYGKASYKNKTLINNYADRAAVPPKLIESILEQLLNKGEQNES